MFGLFARVWLYLTKGGGLIIYTTHSRTINMHSRTSSSGASSCFAVEHGFAARRSLTSSANQTLRHATIATHLGRLSRACSVLLADMLLPRACVFALSRETVALFPLMANMPPPAPSSSPAAAGNNGASGGGGTGAAPSTASTLMSSSAASLAAHLKAEHIEAPIARVQDLHADYSSVCCCVSGTRAAVGKGAGFVIVHVPSLKVMLTMDEAHAAQVLCVALGPAGTIATGSADGVVAVWSLLPDGTDVLGPPLLLSGCHTDWVRSVRFSSDGRGRLLLVSAGDDGRVVRWSALEAAPLSVLVVSMQRSPIRCLALHEAAARDLIAVATDDVGIVVIAAGRRLASRSTSPMTSPSDREATLSSPGQGWSPHPVSSRQNSAPLACLSHLLPDDCRPWRARIQPQHVLVSDEGDPADGAEFAALADVPETDHAWDDVVVRVPPCHSGTVSALALTERWLCVGTEGEWVYVHDMAAGGAVIAKSNAHQTRRFCVGLMHSVVFVDFTCVTSRAIVVQSVASDGTAVLWTLTNIAPPHAPASSSDDGSTNPAGGAVGSAGPLLPERRRITVSGGNDADRAGGSDAPPILTPPLTSFGAIMGMADMASRVISPWLPKGGRAATSAMLNSMWARLPSWPASFTATATDPMSPVTARHAAAWARARSDRFRRVAITEHGEEVDDRAPAESFRTVSELKYQLALSNLLSVSLLNLAVEE